MFHTVSKTVTLPALGLGLLFCLLLTGCAGPGYYAQAVGGHWKLMRARQDVGEVIGQADAELAARLKTSQEILAFAESELGLPAGDSYRSYVETGREAVTWNVVATPEFSLKPRRWCFPVAGCVPYRGYFDREKAGRFAGRLRDKGLDVAVTPVTAYSTLGWFDDPLLDTMMRGPDMLMAATIIHELAHQKLYVKGDTPFNESYARFIEHEGVMAWLQSRAEDEKATNWLFRHHAIRSFNRLLGRKRKLLEALYASDSGEEDMRRSKSKVFDELEQEYVRLMDGAWGGRNYFAGWFASGVNNAKLALFHEYEAGYCAFRELFILAGGDFESFHEAARKRAELSPGERRKWLDESC